MKIKLIYPKWRKLEHQTPFCLPPHAPVVLAAALPDYAELEFVDENVSGLDTGDKPDLVMLSVMLSAQLPRAFAIADSYRRQGVKTLAGGIATMLHHEEMLLHSDSIFLGEAETRMESVLNDFRSGVLKKVYDFMALPPDIALVGTANRNILEKEKYIYRGVKMLDLVHASRGCKFNCFPCCTPFLGGRKFRPRPVHKVVEEIKSIDNNRLFFVDNSLAQDKEWEMELFEAIAPLKKKWVSHPIEEDDKVLELAAKAGCWYVYQAVFDTSDNIRRRIKRYHEHGIGVEATVILGMDEHDEDYIRKLVDFLLEVKLDIAEFTIMTPFMHTPIRMALESQGRIFNNDWSDYTCDRVVFTPAKMTASKLQDMYHYAWETFYAAASPELKMGELFRKVIEREINDGTYQRPQRNGVRKQ